MSEPMSTEREGLAALLAHHRGGRRMSERQTAENDPRRRAALIGLCVHDHCPLNGPHWHGGIWRSGHMRSLNPATAKEKP